MTSKYPDDEFVFDEDSKAKKEHKSLEDELHFSIAGIDPTEFAKKNETTTPNRKELAKKENKADTAADQPVSENRRAIDSAEWKQFEESTKSGFSWDMVLRTMGPNMVVRIILRRQDYSELKLMLESGAISESFDWRYCLDSLDKIRRNGDIDQTKINEYSDLVLYLKRLLEER